MSRSELARRLGVTRQTLHNWERAGIIPAGRRVSLRRTMFDAVAIAAAEALAGSMEVRP